MHITRSDGSLCTLWTNRCVGRPAQRNMGEKSISRSPHTTGARVEEGFKSSGPHRSVARAETSPEPPTPAAPPPEPPPSEPPPPPAATAGDAAAGDAAAQTAAAAPAGPGRRRQLRPKTAAEAETSPPEPPDAHHRSSRTPPDPLPPHTAAGREPSSPPAAARPATATPEKRATPPEPTTELTPPPELPPSPTKLSPPERSPLPKPNANRPAASWAARAVRVSLSAVVSATTSSPRVSPSGRKMSKC